MKNKIIEDLMKVNGLDNVKLLGERLKEDISSLEEKNNIGVRECLKRKYTAILTHDSSFREPEGKIVVYKNEEIIFPAVPFSEIKAKNVVSSSPSKKVHNFIVKKLNLKLNDEATLFIGFD